MPSYKTKQVDEHGKPIYQDVCYPVTKDFREKLYNEIIAEYEKARIRATKKQGRMPDRTTEIPTGIKRIHLFDN